MWTGHVISRCRMSAHESRQALLCAASGLNDVSKSTLGGEALIIR